MTSPLWETPELETRAIANGIIYAPVRSNKERPFNAEDLEFMLSIIKLLEECKAR